MFEPWYCQYVRQHICYDQECNAGLYVNNFRWIVTKTAFWICDEECLCIKSFWIRVGTMWLIEVSSNLNYSMILLKSVFMSYLYLISMEINFLWFILNQKDFSNTVSYSKSNHEQRIMQNEFSSDLLKQWKYLWKTVRNHNQDRRKPKPK